eukprot:14353213-Alexandrium_andersonii.AAC.1
MLQLPAAQGGRLGTWRDVRQLRQPVVGDRPGQPETRQRQKLEDLRTLGLRDHMGQLVERLRVGPEVPRQPDEADIRKVLAKKPGFKGWLLIRGVLRAHDAVGDGAGVNGDSRRRAP